MRLDAPQALEAAHRTNAGHMLRDALVHRPDRHSVESSQCDHLGILAAEKISARGEENKKIIPGNGQASG